MNTRVNGPGQSLSRPVLTPDDQKEWSEAVLVHVADGINKHKDYPGLYPLFFGSVHGALLAPAQRARLGITTFKAEKDRLSAIAWSYQCRFIGGEKPIVDEHSWDDVFFARDKAAPKSLLKIQLMLMVVDPHLFFLFFDKNNPLKMGE